MGDEDYGIDLKVINCLVCEVIEVQQVGVEVVLVIGGGNIFRGVGLVVGGMDCVIGDQMGMLVMVINVLVMQDVFEKLGVKVWVMSVIKINDVCEDYICCCVICYLEKGCLVIFVVGVGSLFFIIDFGVVLCVIEIGVDLLLKVIKVDGVYDKDLNKYSDVVCFDSLSYDEVICRGLEVMDMVVFVLVCDSDLLMCVFDMGQLGELLKIFNGVNIGILVQGCDLV